MEQKRIPTGAFEAVPDEFEARWQQLQRQHNATTVQRQRPQTLKDVPIPGRRRQPTLPPEAPLSSPMKQAINHLSERIEHLQASHWQAAATRDSALLDKFENTQVYVAQYGQELHDLRRRFEAFEPYLARLVKVEESKENRATRLQMMPFGARLIAKYGTDALLVYGVGLCAFFLAWTMVITAIRSPTVEHQPQKASYAATGGMTGGR